MSWIYDLEPDNSSRYTLSPRDPGSCKLLFCFGVNPSTATPNKLDNTVSAVSRIAERHGFDSFFMLNIYPQRATDPNDMHSIGNDDLHAKNVQNIVKYMSRASEVHVLCAWGTLIEKREYLNRYLSDVFESIESLNCNFYRIGRVSKKGHPHHPLYLSNSEVMQEFDLKSYLKK